MFLGESFPQGNYVGDKSSERHSGAISWGKLSGGNYLRDNFPGAIIQGAIIWRQLSGGQLSGGESSGGAIVRGPIIWGAIFLGGNCPDTGPDNESSKRILCKLHCTCTNLKNRRCNSFIIGIHLIEQPVKKKRCLYFFQKKKDVCFKGFRIFKIDFERQ